MIFVVQSWRYFWNRHFFMEEKDFNLASKRLVAMVDFLKWTSTFGEGAIHQMEHPLSGVRFSPGMTRLFGLAEDETGTMLVMHEKEGAWLADLPIQCAFIGYGDELLVVSEAFSLFDVPFERIGIGVLIPSPELRAETAKKTLLGFGLARNQDASETSQEIVTRVNRIVPLYTPERYELMRREHRIETGSLFRA